MKSINNTKKTDGFTLTELMTTVVIIGILSTVALPNYTKSVKKAKQADAINLIMLIQNTSQAYREEFLEAPASWDHLAQITPIPTGNGIASGPWTGNGGQGATTPQGDYIINVSSDEPVINITAIPTSETGKEEPDQSWIVKGCLNSETGYSDIQKGGAEAKCVASNQNSSAGGNSE